MTYFVLTNNSLQVFSKSTQASLSFPPEVIRFQEILDRKAFETLVKNFFAKAGSGESVFFLADEVVYSQSKENATVSNVEEQARAFFEKIPFQQDFLAKKVIRLKKQTFFFATHRDYFTTIIKIVKSFGWDIKYIVPLPLFQSLLQGKQLTYSLLANIVKNKHILEAADFSQEYVLEEDKDFSEEPEDTIPDEPVDSKTSFSLPVRTQYIVAIVCLLCFGAALYFSYPILFPAPVRKTTTKITPTVTRVPSPTLTPVSTPSAFLDKSAIRIEVLNGSGIAGQATVIKNDLVGLGYSQIDTGNATVTSQSSVVSFSSVVAPSLQDQIVQELKKSLETVTAEKVATSDTYDIVITTGNPAQ
ncbi:MAG: LytR C-terminal domain-containing protein [Patescibacteria group bacterium]|nr:LytR C-terminal domain-containing protein [Patescibacteria group bacterium]MDE2589691.1 LytR C-terminal domain-containing protein [Patescibacteria group bacterium]